MCARVFVCVCVPTGRCVHHVCARVPRHVCGPQGSASWVHPMSWCSCTRGWALQVSAGMCVPECARLPQSTLCPSICDSGVLFCVCVCACVCTWGQVLWFGWLTGPACSWQSCVLRVSSSPACCHQPVHGRTGLNYLELSPGLGNLRVTVGRPVSAFLLAAPGAQDGPGDRPRPAPGDLPAAPHL